MTKLEVVKLAANVVVGAGTAKIVKTIIKNNVHPDTVIDQITVTGGSYVLGAMVADLSQRYTNAKIDQAAEWWRKNVKN